jgi:hypothetical protein
MYAADRGLKDLATTFLDKNANPDLRCRVGLIHITLFFFSTNQLPNFRKEKQVLFMRVQAIAEKLSNFSWIGMSS